MIFFCSTFYLIWLLTTVYKNWKSAKQNLAIFRKSDIGQRETERIIQLSDYFCTCDFDLYKHHFVVMVIHTQIPKHHRIYNRDKETVDARTLYSDFSEYKCWRNSVSQATSMEKNSQMSFWSEPKIIGEQDKPLDEKAVVRSWAHVARHFGNHKYQGSVLNGHLSQCPHLHAQRAVLLQRPNRQCKRFKHFIAVFLQVPH